jgi:serine protease AprX
MQADLDGNRIFDDLEATLASMRSETSLPVIVRYKAGHASSARVRGGRSFDISGTVAARLTAREIRELVASGAVESVEEDGILSIDRDSAASGFGLRKGIADLALTGDADGDPARYSPQDLTIAVIDSGIDGSHPDFAGGKIIAWKDFVDDREEPYDDDGHGTHCASIAAGAAPGASLVGVKVLGEDGLARASTVMEGIAWCIENRARYGIDVISLSLSGDNASDGTDAVSRLVDAASAAGLVVCVAAGNDGPTPYTIGSPSAAASVITVGNMIDLDWGGFALHPSSSRGPTLDGRVKPDLCGPGYQILGAEANTGGHTRKSGTSMSCPFVAAVAALVLQAKPSLSPAEVKALLKETAVHFGARGENNEFGAGRLDAYAALAKATGTAGTPPAAPDALHGEGEIAKAGDWFGWKLPVDDTRFPIAATLIQQGPDADFDLEILDPDGSLIAVGFEAGRQETISVQPSKPGTYVIMVRSGLGSGRYLLDVSAGTSVK